MGVFDQRLVVIPDITGEDKLFLRVRLGEPYLNAGGAEQMSYICKTDADAPAQF